MLLHTNIGIILIDFNAVYNYNLNPLNFMSSVMDYFKKIDINNPSEDQISLFFKQNGIKKVIALM